MNIIDRVKKTIETISGDDWKKGVDLYEITKRIGSKWYAAEEDGYAGISERSGYITIGKTKEIERIVFIYQTGSQDWYREMQEFNYFLVKTIRNILDKIRSELAAELRGRMLETEIYVINNTGKGSVEIFRNHFLANEEVENIYEILSLTEKDILRSKIEKHPAFVEYQTQKKDIVSNVYNKEARDNSERLLCMLKLNVDKKEVIDFYSRALNGNNTNDNYKAVERINYVTNLPYKILNPVNFSIIELEKKLDDEIYGMKEAKEAVIRFFTARKYSTGKNKILCLAGNPGTGKSLLAETVSKLLGGESVKIDCSNNNRADEFFKGHSFTFSGAASGEIIMAIERAQAKNSCIILEEFEKGTAENVRSLQSSLITILDPQNAHNFRDHYLQTCFDLSQITFILTCNDISKVNPILLDRLEVVYVNDYTNEEKIEIAKKYMVPRIVKEMGVLKEEMVIDELIYDFIIFKSGKKTLRKVKEALTKIILEKHVEKMREREKGNMNEDNNKIHICTDDVLKIVGVKNRNNEAEREFLEKNISGISTILSINSDGEGVVSHISAVVVKDGMGKISIGGNVSDIIKESTETAVNYIKANYYDSNEKIKEFVDKRHSIHIQEKAFSIKKEGASGGLSTALAVYSAITGIAIDRKKWATTGELDLSGQILMVGGIEEKIAAADEMDIENVIVPIDKSTVLIEKNSIIVTDSIKNVINCVF